MKYCIRTAKIPSIAIAAGLFIALAGPASHAQDEDAHRALYRPSSDTPDEIYFPYFLLSVAREKTGHDQEHAILKVKQRLEFETRDEAVEVYELLQSLLKDLETEENNYMRNEVCQLNKPRPTGRAVYRALNGFDDHKANLGISLLEVIKDQLDAESQRLFTAWFHERKKGATIGILNHEVNHKDSNPDIVLQRICSQFESMQSQTN